MSNLSAFSYLSCHSHSYLEQVRGEERGDGRPRDQGQGGVGEKQKRSGESTGG